jgi:F-type H+-transporting ATPase subunit b
MHLLALMSAADAGHVGELARTFGVDWAHLGAQIVSFAIVCGLLYWLAYTPVLRMLEQRRQQIAQGLANTERINAALAAIETQRRGIIAAAQTEAGRVLEEARAVATRLRQQQMQTAAVAAEQIVRQAREAAAQERTRMLAEVRHEVGHLVVETAAAVTGKILTAADQRRLAEETLRKVA